MGGLSLVVLFGVALPLLFGLLLPLPLRGQFGKDAVLFPLSGMLAVGALAGMQLVVDSFAGERERHTLETLLASPLRDSDILWGKILTVTTYTWVLSVLEGVLGLLTVRVLYGASRVPWPDALLTVQLGALAFLASLLVVLLGTIVSLRARTVRSGQQILAGLIIPLVFLPLGLSVAIALDLFGDGQGLSIGAEPNVLAFLGLVALGLLNAAAFAVVRFAFRRPRLIQLK